MEDLEDRKELLKALGREDEVTDEAALKSLTEADLELARINGFI